MAESLLEPSQPSSDSVPQNNLGPLHCICLAKVTEDKRQAQLDAVSSYLVMIAGR
jgi:hypothetical protein